MSPITLASRYRACQRKRDSLFYWFVYSRTGNSFLLICEPKNPRENKILLFSMTIHFLLQSSTKTSARRDGRKFTSTCIEYDSISLIWRASRRNIISWIRARYRMKNLALFGHNHRKMIYKLPTTFFNLDKNYARRRVSRSIASNENSFECGEICVLNDILVSKCESLDRARKGPSCILI